MHSRNSEDPKDLKEKASSKQIAVHARNRLVDQADCDHYREGYNYVLHYFPPSLSIFCLLNKTDRQILKMHLVTGHNVYILLGISAKTVTTTITTSY